MIDKNPIQLLVLEDDTITIMAYQRMFNDWHVPLDIQWSRSIQEAKQLISNNNFDLALLDYHLEDGDSFEIIPLFP